MGNNAAMIWSVTFLGSLVLFIALLLNPFTSWFALLLSLWCYIDKTPSRGGYQHGFRRKLSNWVRKLPVWQAFRSYFPSKIIIKGKLEKDGKYLLSFHPHGIIGLGVFTQFVYDFTHLQSLPRIRPATLNLNLKIPFLRHLALLNGFISCDYDSMKYVLDGKNLDKGEIQESVLLVTGGGYEAEFTKAKTVTVAINNKNGFIRLCMETGSKLVPVISLGECDTFYIVREESQKTLFQKYSFALLKKIQPLLRKYFGMSFLYFYGDPVFSFLPFPLNLPIIPRKVPITVVIGEPISVPQTSDPTKQQIDMVKEEFRRQVRALVAEYGEPHGIKKVNFQ
eukprot:NODE_13_length_54415_cov_0.522424.p19 type:complete len:337 gc:universal NODE_13_length_54415_cov_0.522424:48328-49338(+)